MERDIQRFLYKKLEFEDKSSNIKESNEGDKRMEINTKKSKKKDRENRKRTKGKVSRGR